MSRGGFNKAAKLVFIVGEVIYRNICSRWNIDSLPAVSQPADVVGAAMRITAGGVALKGAAERQIVFFCGLGGGVCPWCRRILIKAGAASLHLSQPGWMEEEEEEKFVGRKV